MVSGPKTVRKCCVPDCKSTSNNFHVFRFANNAVRFKKWLETFKDSFQCSQDELFLKYGINATSIVCELHFDTRFFSKEWTKKKVVLQPRLGPAPEIFKRQDVILNSLLGKVGLPGRIYLYVNVEIIPAGVEEEKDVCVECLDGPEQCTAKLYVKTFHPYAKPSDAAPVSLEDLASEVQESSVDPGDPSGSSNIKKNIRSISNSSSEDGNGDHNNSPALDLEFYRNLSTGQGRTPTALR